MNPPRSTKKHLAVAVAAMAAACACILAFAGCTSSKAESGYTFSDGAFNCSGKVATIKLDGNPTTGFEWTSKIEGDSVVEKSSDYKASDTSGTKTGGGGTYTFVYEGQKAGTTTITFTYARSWEKSDTDKTVTCAITCDASGNVTASETKHSDGSGGSHKA